MTQVIKLYLFLFSFYIRHLPKDSNTVYLKCADNLAIEIISENKYQFSDLAVCLYPLLLSPSDLSELSSHVSSFRLSIIWYR